MFFPVVKKTSISRENNESHNYQHSPNHDALVPSFNRGRLFAGILLTSGLSLGAALAPSAARAAYAS